ncbi:MAG: T9SS type A sorting domain-containing protein [Sediminicola sp.]
MKHFYTVLLFLVCSVAFSQEAKNSGDIEGFKMYPNPVTNGRVYIKTKENAPKKIMIFDVLGTQVLETTIFGQELNVADFDAGIYMIRVFEKEKVTTRKLIIK